MNYNNRNFKANFYYFFVTFVHPLRLIPTTRKGVFTMKKITIIILTMALAFVISACSEKSTSAPEETTKPIEPSKSAKEMTEEMLKVVEQPNMAELTEDDIVNVYNIDPTKLEDFSANIPLMNVKANELAIFKVKDTKDVAEILAQVKVRSENAMNAFDHYLPDQYEIAKNYTVVEKGNYVLFIISEQADELVTIFNEFFEKK